MVNLNDCGFTDAEVSKILLIAKLFHAQRIFVSDYVKKS